MSTIRLKKLLIKRFRSFQEVILDFDNPLFIVGQNGSGKSNLADAFSLVSEAMTSPLQAVFDKRGGIASVRNRRAGQSHPPNMGFAFEFSSTPEMKEGRYAFEISSLPNYGFKIVREQCKVSMTKGERWWFDREKKWLSNAIGLTPAVEPNALSLPLVGGDERFSPIYKLLSAMKSYSVQPSKLRELQEPDSGVALRSDGGNAASVLQELIRGEDGEARAISINDLLKTIAPAIKSVSPKKHSNKMSLTFTQEWRDGSIAFDAYNMSDGTLRSLGLILSVYQQPSPSLLIIEEPEATIHPGALGAILDLIRQASKTMQVVVTSHSPELLSASWLKDNHIRIIQWRDGVSRIQTLSTSDREAIQKGLASAGELIVSNRLNIGEDNIAPFVLFEPVQ